jgi:hypothetical protein
VEVIFATKPPGLGLRCPGRGLRKRSTVKPLGTFLIQLGRGGYDKNGISQQLAIISFLTRLCIGIWSSRSLKIIVHTIFFLPLPKLPNPGLINT